MGYMDPHPGHRHVATSGTFVICLGWDQNAVDMLANWVRAYLEDRALELALNYLDCFEMLAIVVAYRACSFGEEQKQTQLLKIALLRRGRVSVQLD